MLKEKPAVYTERRATPDSPRSVGVGLAEVVGRFSGDLNFIYHPHPWDGVTVGPVADFMKYNKLVRLLSTGRCHQNRHPADRICVSTSYNKRG